MNGASDSCIQGDGIGLRTNFEVEFTELRRCGPDQCAFEAVNAFQIQSILIRFITCLAANGPDGGGVFPLAGHPGNRIGLEKFAQYLAPEPPVERSKADGPDFPGADQG